MNKLVINTNKPWFAYAMAAALLLAVILAGCAPATTPLPPTPIPPTPVPPTEVPAAPTALPTAVIPAATADDPAYYQGQPVPVVPAGIAGQPMVTAAYNTTINSGPGTDYVVYGAFLGSATAQAVGISQDGQWYAVSVPVAPGGIGWVSAAYALAQNTINLPVLQAPPVPPTVELVPPGPSDPQAVSLANVYVRNGPGTQYPAYGIAKTGVTARVIGKSVDGQYLVIRIDPQMVGNGYGWVAIAYTQPSNIEAVPVIATPEQPPVVQIPPPPSGVPSATAVDFVNVRSGPGTNYLVYGVAQPGASAEVSGMSQDGLWWQVKIPNTSIPEGVAWVSANYVYTSNTGSVPVIAAPPPLETVIPTTPSTDNSCTLVSQTPQDNSTFPLSYGFGVQWVLQNTGTATWQVGETDIVFLGAMNGQRLHQNNDVFDLPYTVRPGESLILDGSLITPANPGIYGEAWAIQQGQKNVYCTFWIVVNAE